MTVAVDIPTATVFADATVADAFSDFITVQPPLSMLIYILGTIGKEAKTNKWQEGNNKKCTTTKCHLAPLQQLL